MTCEGAVAELRQAGVFMVAGSGFDLAMRIVPSKYPVGQTADRRQYFLEEMNMGVSSQTRISLRSYLLITSGAFDMVVGRVHEDYG